MEIKEKLRLITAHLFLADKGCKTLGECADVVEEHIEKIIALFDEDCEKQRLKSYDAGYREGHLDGRTHQPVRKDLGKPLRK